jgi:hypothetical protein
MPLTAASVTGAWVVGRVLYHLGYVTGDPANVRPLALYSDRCLWRQQRGRRGGFIGSIALLGTSSFHPSLSVLIWSAGSLGTATYSIVQILRRTA